MQVQYLIKGGQVVDGTGSPPYLADVRVHNGSIAEIEPGIQPAARERVIDAAGCYVTPGFIESHNHYDGHMWWVPTMDPLPDYGVTTSVNGNCGFSAAPVHKDAAVRKEMIDIFTFFEDIPDRPFLQVLPWNWRKWSEYKTSMQRNVKLPVNFAAYVGHIAIRLTVMGLEAWDRAATAEEIRSMCALLEDALGAGALGLSSNLLDHDSKNRPIPSMLANDAEWTALMDVVARYPGRTIQLVVDHLMRMTGLASVERIGRLAEGRGLRILFLGSIPTLEFQAPLFEATQAQHAAFKARGLDYWTQYHHVSPTTMVSFLSSLVCAQSNNYVWHEIVTAATEQEKLTLLASPEWRARARISWEQTFDQSPMKYPTELILRDSETGFGPEEITLEEYRAMKQIDHCSDALAEWLLDNGIRSNLFMKSWKVHEDSILDLARDPRALGNVSDSGAHGKMFCGAGDNVLLLTKYVRDRKLLKIEEAVHVLTGQPAEFFGLNDRGVLAVGKRADIAVFNLAEIERRKDQKVWDVPDGEGGRTFRYTRAPAPMRLTLVNGVATFDKGAYTGTFPGQYIGPTAEPITQTSVPIARSA